jgi:cell division protein FtsB
MAGRSKATGVLKFFGLAGLMLAAWIALSLEPIRKLHDAYTSLTHEREQVALLEQQVQMLERQIKSTKALGPELEVQLRQQGMVRPGETVIIVKPEEAATSATEGRSTQRP